MGRETEQIFLKTYRLPIVRETVLSITNYQESTNQNHSEISSRLLE